MFGLTLAATASPAQLFIIDQDRHFKNSLVVRSLGTNDLVPRPRALLRLHQLLQCRLEIERAMGGYPLDLFSKQSLRHPQHNPKAAVALERRKHRFVGIRQQGRLVTPPTELFAPSKHQKASEFNLLRQLR